MESEWWPGVSQLENQTMSIAYWILVKLHYQLLFLKGALFFKILHEMQFFPLLEILYVVLIENKKEIIDSLVSEWKATTKAPHYILNKIKMNLLIL